MSLSSDAIRTEGEKRRVKKKMLSFLKEKKDDRRDDGPVKNLTAFLRVNHPLAKPEIPHHPQGETKVERLPSSPGRDEGRAPPVIPRETEGRAPPVIPRETEGRAPGDLDQDLICD